MLSLALELESMGQDLRTSSIPDFECCIGDRWLRFGVSPNFHVMSSSENDHDLLCASAGFLVVYNLLNKNKKKRR